MAVMPATRPQAISGVTVDRENVLMTIYPSIAAGGFGRGLGKFCNCIPVSIFGLRLSHLLFALPAALPALLAYALQRIRGCRYVLTNKSVQEWAALGSRRLGSADLEAIESIEVSQLPGQEFYKAANLILRAADGESLLQLAGVPRADVFRETILKARDAQRHVADALSVITARQATP